MSKLLIATTNPSKLQEAVSILGGNFEVLSLKDFENINFVASRSIIHAILGAVKEKNIDLLIIGAAKPKFLHEIRVGSLAENLVKNISCSVMIIRGHQGVAEAFWLKLLKKLNPQKLYTP